MGTYWIVSWFVTSQLLTTRCRKEQRRWTHQSDHTDIIIQGCSRKCINYEAYPANTARREQFRSEEQPNKIVLMVVMSWLYKWRAILGVKAKHKCVESRGDRSI
ncbi:hypothetical protein HanRHA438_Chr03g0113501 [Helianthus annuus]|uniref:Uncharacterized protein n=1 Tax=Helianthus annuus TaxID=4232 RepID=A0A9K3NVP8_HELAN|nr:uncharacterized protein LOC110937056 [Helianthus annuus]KAF5801036.1 hypothetical protein HanXRQr2_Chr06g0243461 [Helianthus annuus]KAF5813770.1 hypothetical protein HanXRQr2_Chr03g0102621 [Helianthus annuus]KAJ0589850.1 hypothetical protein HanIR_Chr04g0190881 [Helianthus annuus]KAJ0739729.1 hypothetical protein HanOQP8_Chr06g0208951 [Helianthus annuus]KAJ0773349.1 hypothetical protein HanOQP8_Chr03g0098241 [Helianthus annuus]